ncbi:NAD(P)/FAD-dependent oxidoreductase [Clostridium sp. KNHs205]|uniref:flavin monoamine oxidase family protein n=1 Tax=Clostridium sp. KNHs205 TaxID=1449050 RepID=UPI00051B0B20|nr:NAD(P)/FAD-dependent oxidoreductase [Clostridium sp. KNHs205]
MTNIHTFMNPTDTQRYQMLSNSLKGAGRSEDLYNIIELLNPPPDINTYIEPGGLKKVRIGIIGAGLAGLAAAFELRKTGADITVFEANEERIGGRVYTYYFDRSRNYYGEFGAMRIPVSHGTTWHYINLFNLMTVPSSQGMPNNFIYVHNTRTRKDPEGANIMEYLYPLYNLTPAERNTPWNQLNDYAFSSLLKELSPDTRKELLQILPYYSPQILPYINQSVRQILEDLGLSQDAITLLASVNSLTGDTLAANYFETLSEEYSMDYANVYRISGGMEYLPYAFYNSLTNLTPDEYTISKEDLGNCQVNMGYYVNGIYQLEDNKVLLRYNTPGLRNQTEEFDYIICAIPFSLLRTFDIKPFFTNQKMQAIRELNYYNSLKASFLSKRRFWEEDTDYGRMNGGFSATDLPIRTIFYPTDHLACLEEWGCTPNEPGVFTASYNIGLDAVRVGAFPEEQRFSYIKRNVEEVHGLPEDYLNRLITGHKTVNWNEEPFAKGAFATNLPGQLLNFGYDMLLPEYNNRVFFAGEHTSSKHGWMQGALYSGMFAANCLAYNSYQ